MANDPFGARTTLKTGSGDVELYSLKVLDENVDGDVFSLPFSIRVMLESLLRNAGGKFVSKEDVEALADWPGSIGGELAYLPARVVMQDFTGVPAVVDLAGIQGRSTLSFRRIWSSTIQSRSTRSGRPRPCSSTPSASSSATASATSFSSGASRPSTTSPSYRRPRASSTRSTWSTWRRVLS